MSTPTQLRTPTRPAPLRPDPLAGHFERAVALLHAGDWAGALGSVEGALGSGVDTALLHTLRGLALAGLARLDEALASYDAALTRDATYGPAHINRGSVLRRCGRPLDALASYDAALARGLPSFEAWCNRAAVLVDLGRFEEALADCACAAALQPGRVEIAVHRGAALMGLERFEEALESFEHAIRLRPEHAGAHVGRAGALQYLGRHDAALESADRAIALNPALPAGHFNRAAALTDLARLEEAVASLRAAHALEPENPVIACNLGRLLLLQGRFALGWPLYEWRTRLPTAQRLHGFAQPSWDGTIDLRDKTLFVYVDQGLGDTLQFVRYARLAELAGARVILSVQSGLHRLLSTLSPTLTLLGESHKPKAFDAHCPLASLPRAFATRLETVPAPVPYLAAPPERSEYWRDRLGQGGFKIGICWQGAVVKSGMGRSFPLAALAPVAMVPGVRLISLQRGAGVEQLGDLPPGMVIEVPPEPVDAAPDAFLDTAAIMQHLDLILTCDTSIAHLAGALGRPTWVVLKRVPDWRWLMERADSPWYPTMRLFRQSIAGQWDDVFAAVHAALGEQLAHIRLTGS